MTLPIRQVTVFLTAIILCTGISSTSIAQNDFVYWPDADYDPAIPTIEQVLGYLPGERIEYR